MKLIDSHCHIDSEKFDADREAVIERALEAGVGHMVVIGSGGGPPDLEAGIRLADRHASCYATVCVHPHDASKATAETYRRLEDLVKHTGYTLALVVVLVVPFVWSLPTALMVSELSSAIPEEGGFYAWVRRGLGPFWGFQEAWLSLVSSIFDMALYPVLFCTYLGGMKARPIE